LAAVSICLTAGLIDKNPYEDNPSQHLANFEAYLLKLREIAQIEFDQELLDRMKRSSQGGNWTRFMLDAADACHCRKLFFTRNGYFGLGPEAMEEGDLCCILFGARVPFILRRVGHQYLLVGESYIHGVMRGEVIEQWKNGELEVETFEIR
jgi:hypothetical protein